MAGVLRRHWCALCIATAQWILGVNCVLFTVDLVPCPNPAENCLQEWFNRVVEGIGCLGCLSGCQPGYMMTANPRYYVDAENSTGHYQYHGISINSNINISEPQWICDKGDSCQSGFYPTSKMGSIDTCSWCGSGCASCTSYDNCQRCFMGYTLDSHHLPGENQIVALCKHSQVPCPSPPSHCLHDTYVTAGMGCVGCQACEDGYMVTSNPAYLNASSTTRANTTAGATYDYMGLEIRDGIDINEPRLVCIAGYSCQDGWFPSVLGSSTVCAECSSECAQCSSRTKCNVCKDGYTLQELNANAASCTAAST